MYIRQEQLPRLKEYEYSGRYTSNHPYDNIKRS